MADAITTYNPVDKTTFIVNKYDDIDGGRVAQSTPRGRLCFRDTDGRLTLPRSVAEANRAVYPVDWAKPLNPPPYFDGPGLNGATLYPFSDGSLNAQDTSFAMDPDTAFQTPWPAAIKQYDLPPMLYNLPVTSGNKALIYDGEGTYTYGSGNYVGVSSDYNIGSKLYAAYASGSEGKLTVSGLLDSQVVVGIVVNKDVFGPNTLTVKMHGTPLLFG